MSRSSLQARTPTPHLRTMPRCSTTSRLIVEHYLVVLCLSHGISARGSNPGSVLTCTWSGVTLPLSSSDVRSSGCMQQQGMQYYVDRTEADGLLAPISGLQYDNSADTGDPRARLAALAGHLGSRARLYSHHKPLTDHLVSQPI